MSVLIKEYSLKSQIDRVRMVNYSGVRLSKSIDLVSTSPFFLKYSRIIPGG
jgi:hypothetical protein